MNTKSAYPAESAFTPQLKRALLVLAGLGALSLALVVLALSLGDPPPPKSVRLATGGEGGAYAGYGARLAKRLGQWGLRVELVGTQGSLENYSRLTLNDPAEGVDLAFVQGGLVKEAFPDLPEDQEPTVLTVGALYTEPLWLFYRSTEAQPPLELLGNLRGKINLGPLGSGTEPVARLLASENGIDPSRHAMLTNAEATEALQAGRIEAMFMIASPEAPIVSELLQAKGIRLFDFQRYVAYSKRFPFLSRVQLAQGVVNLHQNLPAQDISLLGPQAMLACREETHPHVAKLFAKAAKEVFGRGNLLDPPGRFPSLENTDLLPHPAAEEFYRYGESWLARNLPFWAVRLLSRLTLVLIPMITLLFPGVKVLLMILDGRLHHLLTRHYKKLRQSEARLAEAETIDQVKEQLELLKTVEAGVKAEAKTFTGRYHSRHYDLCMHVKLVLGEAQRKLEALE